MMSEHEHEGVVYFPERYGYVPVRRALQYESLDSRTMNRLWSVVYNTLPRGFDEILEFRVRDRTREDRVRRYPTKAIEKFARAFYDECLGQPLDEFPEYCEAAIRRNFVESMKSRFFSAWYECFRVIEFMLHKFPFGGEKRRARFVESVNKVLVEERTAYRIVYRYVVPITDPNEIESIEQAIQQSPDPVAQHLRQALEHLANRENPQYKDSIHDSILAVEALCNLVLGKTNDSLGDLLKRLNLPPVLREAFKKLYGYTSGPYGIRHALTVEEEAEVGFDEAKLMLVLCSGFVNYVRAKQATAQLGDEGGADSEP